MSRGVLGLKPVTKSAETTLRQNLSMVARLRRHRFEVLIKLVYAACGVLRPNLRPG
jgi:hypothetical protein